MYCVWPLSQTQYIQESFTLTTLYMLYLMLAYGSFPQLREVYRVLSHSVWEARAFKHLYSWKKILATGGLDLKWSVRILTWTSISVISVTKFTKHYTPTTIWRQILDVLDMYRLCLAKNVTSLFFHYHVSIAWLFQLILINHNYNHFL